jgi:5-methylcytosine-specific restriction endonuclease McrA
LKAWLIYKITLKNPWYKDFHQEMKTMDFNNFSDQELVASFQRVVREERRIMHVVLLHIQEVAKRKFYLARGFSSLFEYLTVEMKYSGAAAQRRIEAARLITAVPSVALSLQSGGLNLSQIADIQKAVKIAEKIHEVKVSTEIKAELVEKVLSQTVSTTQQICAEMLNIPVLQAEKLKTQKDHSKRIEFTFSEVQFAKYEKLRDRYAERNFKNKRTANMADVLETLFDVILERDELSDTRSKNRKASPPEKAKDVETLGADLGCVSNLNDTASCTSARDENSISASEVKWHSLTSKRKKIILQRDECCQFMDLKTGRVCGSRFNLEVDHIQPKWDGGGHAPENLRVLCRAHNQFRYSH